MVATSYYVEALALWGGRNETRSRDKLPWNLHRVLETTLPANHSSLSPEYTMRRGMAPLAFPSSD